MGQAFPGRRRQPHQEVAREPRGQQLSGFREDVIAGLSLPRRSLPPKYFYDAAGSRLFERICRLREYYLTRAELALTRAHIAAIARFAGGRGTLIEYGSGASVKSRLLLRALRPATYNAGDISHDPLHAAYNDAKGVTATFNLNLLRRINRELGGDFDLRRFAHYAFYNPGPGRIEMHLVSLARQTVDVGAHRFAFDAGESIHTENSYKYSIAEFRDLAAKAGFKGAKVWTDRRGLFSFHGLVAV